MSVKTMMAATLAAATVATGVVPDNPVMERVRTEIKEGIVQRMQQASFQRDGNVIVFMYHNVIPEEQIAPMTEAEKRLNTTPEKLAADIDVMRDMGYQSISLQDYYLGKAEPGKKYFILTFDDGYSGNYDYAFPVLQEKKAYGDIFAITSLFWEPNHFTIEQAKEMERSGLVHVYSHSHEHISPVERSFEEFKKDFLLSHDTLRNYLGDKGLWFYAYPFGGYNQQIFDFVKEQNVGFQLMMGRKFEEERLLLRVNVCYDSDMRQLVKTTPHN